MLGRIRDSSKELKREDEVGGRFCFAEGFPTSSSGRSKIFTKSPPPPAGHKIKSQRF